MTQLTWTSETDSGGGITASSSSDDIEITEDGDYKHDITIWYTHDELSGGGNSTYRRMALLQLALFTDAIQNPTFEFLEARGHDSFAAIHTHHVAVIVNYSSVSNDSLTVRAQATTGDVDIYEAYWTVQKLD